VPILFLGELAARTIYQSPITKEVKSSKANEISKKLFKFSFSTEIYQCLAVGLATQPRRRGILFLYCLKNHGKNQFLNSF
jgi:hypothetical protein